MDTDLHLPTTNSSSTNNLASGVKVDDECQREYEKLKLKHCYSFVIFKISSDFKKIVVDCIGEKGAGFDDFKRKMEEGSAKKEGRYGIIDLEYAAGKANKLVFVMWLPDNEVDMKQKMLYTTSKRALTDKLQGLPIILQCNDQDDFSWSNIIEKCQSKYD